MSVRRIVASGGLSTDPTALDQPNALRRAENVILHRPGSIQVRPGFGDTTGIAARETTHRPVAIVAFGGDMLVEKYDSAGGGHSLVRLSAETGYGAAFDLPNDDVRGVASFMRARGNLYFTTDDGVHKVSDLDAEDVSTEGGSAGMWMTYQPPAISVSEATDVDNAAFPPDTSIAWRWCSVRTDANGYEVRSSPSSRLVFAPFSDATYSNGFNMYLGSIALPAEAAEDDILELYRTVNTNDLTADPGEDYFLVGKYTLVADDITNGYTPEHTWFDSIKDVGLGPALYTSASQFGALSAKELPPVCVNLAWWNGVAWAGYLAERALEVITVAKVAYYDTTNSRPVNEGTGLCTLAGSYTGVSGNSLTGVTFTGSPSTLGWDSLQFGQWISDSTPTTSGGRIPLGTRIESFDESEQTITLSDTPSGSGTFKAGDIVDVSSTEFYAYSTESVASGWFRVTSSDFYSTREYQAALSLARVISYAFTSDLVGPYAIKEPVTVNGDGNIVLIGDSPSTSFGVSSTRGSAFVPDLSATLTADTTNRPGRIAWSAANEPEAWPPANFATIGNEYSAVLALTPLNDALLVWKTDGLYAVVGTPPNSWAINPIDTSLRLLTSQAVCVLDGVCYAFTNRGVVAVSAGGPQVVSGPIASDLRQYQEVLPVDVTGGKRGFWMVAHERLGLVILGVAESTTAEYAAREYVYHVSTGRWSTWERDDRCMAYDPAEDRMVVSPSDALTWTLFYERNDESDAASYRDASLSFTCTLDGTVVTVNHDKFNGYVPAEGDIIVVAGVPARVTSIETSGSNFLLTTTGGLSAGGGTVTWHQSIPAVVQWQAQQMPGYSSRWSEIHVGLLDAESEYVSGWPLAVGGATERDSSATTLDATVDSTVTYSRPVRVGPHRNLVRAAHLYPQIGVSCAGVKWRVGELVLHGVPTSRRVAR